MSITPEQYRAEVNRRMSEKAFQAQVVQQAQILGWLVKWTWKSIHSPKGDLDLRLFRPPRIIFAEIKTATGVLTKEQREMIAVLEQCPQVEVYVWKPSDYADVQRILQ